MLVICKKGCIFAVRNDYVDIMNRKLKAKIIFGNTNRGIEQ